MKKLVAITLTIAVIAAGSIYSVWPVDPELAAHKVRCQRVADDLEAKGLKSSEIMSKCLALRQG